MGNDVYLCLSTLKAGAMAGGFMAFLVLAETHDIASHSADLYISYIETLGAPGQNRHEMMRVQQGLASLRTQVALLDEDREIRMVSRTIGANFPEIGMHLMTHHGAVALLPVRDDQGFEPATLHALRSRMAKHHVAAKLNVGIA
jgi:hypothetical protein